MVGASDDTLASACPATARRAAPIRQTHTCSGIALWDGVEDTKVMPVQPIIAASDFIGRTESPTLDEVGFKIFPDGCVFHLPPAWARAEVVVVRERVSSMSIP